MPFFLALSSCDPAAPLRIYATARVLKPRLAANECERSAEGKKDEMPPSSAENQKSTVIM